MWEAISLSGMAEIRLAEIINDNSWDLRDSLAKAVRQVMGRSADFDEHDLYQAFEDAVRWRFRTWIPVDDGHVKVTLEEPS